MRFTKKIVLVMLATLLFGIDSTSAMSRIKELWSPSSKSKFTDAPTRTEAKQSESKSSSEHPERGYQTTRSTLDELGIVGRSERSTRDASQSRSTRGAKESTEPAKESRSFLQRIMGRGRSESKIEISSPTGFRITTDKSLDTPELRAFKESISKQKEQVISDIAIRAKRREEQEIKAKEVTKDLSNVTNQLGITRSKINEEMKKAPEDRDQKLLNQLNLEKKKLGDKASSMEKTIKNIETRARLDGLSTQELSTEVAQLQKKADQAQKDLALAQAEQDLKVNRLKEVRKNLSSEDRQKYADLAASHKEVEAKLADKTTPKDEISKLVDQRKTIRTDIQNISPDLAKRHYELADQEATFVTAKKNVQLAQSPLTIAKFVLEERTAPKEPEPIKTATTKKSVGFSEVTEDLTAKEKKTYDSTAVPIKGILKKSAETESVEPVASRRRGVGFGAIETTDTLQKKEPLPADVQPAKGILKQPKRVGFGEDIETAPKKNIGFGIDQKSLEEFEKKAGPPPSKLPPLPPEADKTPNLEGVSPAMRKILQDEERKFQQNKKVPQAPVKETEESKKSSSTSATGSSLKPEEDKSQNWISTIQDPSRVKDIDQMRTGAKGIRFQDLEPSTQQERLKKIHQENLRLIDQEKQPTQ